MDSTSAASERIAIVRVKRKAIDAAADTLSVLPLVRHQAAVNILIIRPVQQHSLSLELLSCAACGAASLEGLPANFVCPPMGSTA